MEVDPWSRPVRLYRGSALGALSHDWKRVEGDFWVALERLREELDRVPEDVRDRVVDALAQYLKTRSVE
jgi:hypothetical protein